MTSQAWGGVWGGISGHLNVMAHWQTLSKLKLKDKDVYVDGFKVYASDKVP